MLIDKLSATVLLVRDFQASVTFYRDVLGFPAGETTEDFIAFLFPGHTLALMDVKSADKMIGHGAIRPEAQGVHRAFMAVFVEDADALYEELKAKGVPFVSPPVTQPWGQRTAYFTDPDNNIWEISHFLKEEQASG